MIQRSLEGCRQGTLWVRVRSGRSGVVVEGPGMNRSSFIAEHNEAESKPFVWSAEPDAIIAARSRGLQALESIH